MSLVQNCFLLKSKYCCCLVSKSCMTLCDPMDYSPPVSSVHEISQQEYWSGLPFSSPRDLPYPHLLHWQADSSPLNHQGIPIKKSYMLKQSSVKYLNLYSNMFVCALLLSHVRLFATPWTVAQRSSMLLWTWDFSSKNTRLGYQILP